MLYVICVCVFAHFIFICLHECMHASVFVHPSYVDPILLITMIASGAN